WLGRARWIDVCRQGARRRFHVPVSGLEISDRLRLELGQENRMHAAVCAGFDRDRSNPAFDVFRESAFLARLLRLHRRRDFLRNFIDWTFLARVEGGWRRGIAGRTGVEDIALLADIDARLGFSHLEMVV